jgi:hypothetical protein
VNERLFKSMSPEAAKFYHRVFNRILLNIHAVKIGLFPTLFCETDDPRVALRWSAALPTIVETMHKRAQDKGEDFGR